MPIIIPSTESMTVEFKSDRNGYPDRELIEALTCLANTQGGELWLGIEDNGSASGLHPRHQDIVQLTQLVADNTSPSLQVTVTHHQINGVTVAQILVPEAKRLVATKEGAYLRRRLKHDDTLECIHIPSSDEPLPR
ncbi:MAG: ATP-binding protein [Shewanella sp.]|nr:ATP-binding protein [Shewanella sp.]